MWRAEAVSDSLFSLCLKTEWSWLPVLRVLDWEEIPYEWVVDCNLGEECGFFALRAVGPSIPLLVGALTRERPMLLAALRPSLCQQHPQYASCATAGEPDKKEPALIELMLTEHVPSRSDVIEDYLQKSRKVWKSIQATADKRRRKKQEDEDLLDEGDGESDGETGDIPEHIADFLFAAVDGIEPDQLEARDKKMFKGPEAMERLARQKASTLVEKSKAALAAKNSLDQDAETTGEEGKAAESVPSEAEPVVSANLPEPASVSERNFMKKSNMRWAAPFIPDSVHECRLTSGRSVPGQQIIAFYQKFPLVFATQRAFF